VNILYVHRTQGAGVEGVHIWEIVRALKAEGHVVRVLGPAGETADPDVVPANQPEPGTAGRGSFLRLISRHLPELLFELAEIAYNAVALRRLKGHFADFPFDVMFERYAIFSVAGSVFARSRGRRWFLEVNYTARSPLVRRRTRLLKPLAIRIDRWLFRRADGIFAVSTTLKAELVRVHGIDPAKVIVVSNAADPEKFSPSVPPVARINGQSLVGHRLIGFLGGFYPWHGVDLLVRAFGTLTREFPDIRLLLIGDGPERPAIESLAGEQDLAERIFFTGPVSHDHLPSYLAAFHVGVMPDSNDYGSPMKVFEYMAMGKPVVVPDYPPLLDAIADGREGRAFRRRDLTALTDSLRSLLDDEPTYHRMASAAREAVVQDHNWRNNARRIMALIESSRGP
jgi:glycosyltransferase involved in cell wall biosynthesis